jgi:ParB family transcriptional regulator, chromosome partitioning protein
MRQMPLKSLNPPSNDPRHSRDAGYIGRLAADIKVRGVRHPIYAFRRADGQHEVLTGETRRLAAIEAGLAEVPVIILERPLTDVEILMERLLENEMRSDFSPLERAKIYADLLRLNGWSQAELAAAIGVSEGEVSRTLTVSKRLPADLLAHVVAGRLCPTIAYHLSRLADPEAMRALADKAIKGLLTRDAAVAHVSKMTGGKSRRAKPVKVRTQGGVSVVIPHSDAEAVIAELASLIEAVKKTQKFGLPLSSLPSLLRSA